MFRIEDALDAINQKLVRRHPHVFGDETAETAGDVQANLGRDQGRGEEARRAGKSRACSDGVPRALPALVEAQQITVARRAAWASIGRTRSRCSRSCTRSSANSTRRDATPSPRRLEDELGDLLFVLVNLARFVKVDPEQALRRTNAKFRERFGYIERQLAERGETPQDSNIDEMEALWQEAKR